MFREMAARLVAVTAGILLWGACAGAALAAPAHGIIKVNGPGDTNTSDAALTLREAMHIANGGTGASGLNRALSASEVAQLSGCTVNGSNLITAGCGAGVADDIRFDANLTVTVNSPLPTLTDAGTDINGFNLFFATRIDAQGMATGDVFTVNGSNLWLRGMNVFHYPAGGSAVRVISATGALIEANTLGLRSLQSDCTGLVRQGFHGIRIDRGREAEFEATPTVAIASNIIGCHHNSGILLDGSDGVDIGFDLEGDAKPNYIGGYVSGANVYTLPNGANGIYLLADTGVSPADGANDNRIANNVIAGNAGHGILIRGATGITTTRFNHVTRNRIGVFANGVPMGNALSGIKIERGAISNYIGGDDEGNVVNNNRRFGLHIEQSSFTRVLGNVFGVYTPTLAAQGNVSHGVYISNSVATRLGFDDGGFGAVFGPNAVVASSGDGIVLDGGEGNHVYTNTIGLFYSGGTEHALPNAGHGVTLRGNTRENLIGNLDFRKGNLIVGNAGFGVSVEGAALLNIVAGNHGIIGNGLGGVRLAGLSFNRVGTVTRTNVISANLGPGVLVEAGLSIVEGNTIERNAGSGVVISSTSGNKVSGGVANYNAGHGYELRGSLAQGNVITGVVAFRNMGDGISEHAGAGDNMWRRLVTVGNGGLGIDKYADNPAANIVTGPYPLIESVEHARAGSTHYLTVTGSAAPPVGLPGIITLTIDLYLTDSPPDPSRHGEANWPIGDATANPQGKWTMNIQYTGIFPVGCLTAAQTARSPVAGGTEISSEFGPNWCVNRAYIPTVRRVASAGW